MIEYSDKKYHKKEVSSFSELDHETQKILSWVAESKSVLEFGCHTGRLSEWLQKKQCDVIGVEVNQSAINDATPFLKKQIVGNIESDEVWESISSDKFDVIIFSHVLEHLTDPWSILKKSTEFLKKNGVIIIALPNINNAKDRFKILFGNFDYSEEGVMDKTHLRFFNQKTARELIEGAGLCVKEYFSPRKVNPIHYFFDHLPILWRIKKIIPANKNRIFFRKNSNFTDVVMMFICRKNDI